MLKRDIVSPQPVFQAFLPLTCLVAASLAMDTLVTVDRDIKCLKKKERKNLRRCLLYPVNVCFFAILFQTSFIAGIEISIFQKPRIEKMVKF